MRERYVLLLAGLIATACTPPFLRAAESTPIAPLQPTPATSPCLPFEEVIGLITDTIDPHLRANGGSVHILTVTKELGPNTVVTLTNRNGVVCWRAEELNLFGMPVDDPTA